MDNVINRILFIPRPSCANGLGIMNWGRLVKTVRFPRQVAECLTENVLLEHFPFLYRDFSFTAF